MIQDNSLLSACCAAGIGPNTVSSAELRRLWDERGGAGVIFSQASVRAWSTQVSQLLPWPAFPASPYKVFSLLSCFLCRPSVLPSQAKWLTFRSHLSRGSTLAQHFFSLREEALTAPPLPSGLPRVGTHPLALQGPSGIQAPTCHGLWSSHLRSAMLPLMGSAGGADRTLQRLSSQHPS